MTFFARPLALVILLLPIASVVILCETKDEVRTKKPPTDPFGKLDKKSLFEPDTDPTNSRDELSKRLESAASNPRSALEILRKLPKKPSPSQLTSLRQLDRKVVSQQTEEFQAVAREVLAVLARSGDPRALGYVRQVFEEAPNRRGDAAQALAVAALNGPRRPQDWRLLVRSLPVVEGQQAFDVLRALQRFAQRSNKAAWQRHVILAGLRLGDARSSEAVKLLQHWTGSEVGDPTSSGKSLAEWQAWFHRIHPELPAAKLPVDPADAKHKSADLLRFLRSPAGLRGDAKLGAKVFEQAQCLKCHEFSGRGEATGPALTNVTRRLADVEIVQSLLFPSHEIPDDYVSKKVLTVNGKVLTGLVNVVGPNLIVLQANGEKATVPRNSVDEILSSRASSMPAGLLEPLSRDDIADLFAFMRKGR